MLTKEVEKMFKEKFLENPHTYAHMLDVNQDEMHFKAPSEKGLQLNIQAKDYFCQMWEGVSEEIIDKLIITELWQEILHGNLQYHICETPPCFADSEIEKNDELVKSYVICLPKANIIDAAFWGGKKDEDGFIKFSKPPIKTRTHFPLEVGYCKAAQFYSLLIQRGCCARLPYGENYIIFFEFNRADMFGL